MEELREHHKKVLDNCERSTHPQSTSNINTWLEFVYKHILHDVCASLWQLIWFAFLSFFFSSSLFPFSRSFREYWHQKLLKSVDGPIGLIHWLYVGDRTLDIYNIIIDRCVCFCWAQKHFIHALMLRKCKKTWSIHHLPNFLLCSNISHVCEFAFSAQNIGLSAGISCNEECATIRYSIFQFVATDDKYLSLLRSKYRNEIYFVTLTPAIAADRICKTESAYGATIKKMNVILNGDTFFASFAKKQSFSRSCCWHWPFKSYMWLLMAQWRSIRSTVVGNKCPLIIVELCACCWWMNKKK